MKIDDIDNAEERQTLQTLADSYINAWSATDVDARESFVKSVYADDAEFFSSENGDLRLQGHDAIAENIGHVNERDIQGHGLTIKHVGTFVNHHVAKVTWQMLAGDGEVALAGMNVLVLDDADKIAQDLIFVC